jgi:hypothetical protein
MPLISTFKAVIQALAYLRAYILLSMFVIYQYPVQTDNPQ